jgi:hypothetical protein
MLEPYLAATPSAGFRKLAELIAFGYFDAIITFNFDRLLETAFNDYHFTDFKTIVRGETDLAAIPELMKSATPRVKILKMHGSLQSANYFLFSKEEMLNYPPELATVVGELTGRDIIICGYAFEDACVIRAFNASKEAGSIYFVNPSGATGQIKGFLPARKSQEKVIAGDLGKFDAFVTALHGELTAPAVSVSAAGRQNLFKFLDCYSEEHADYFIGRAWVRAKVKKAILEAPAGILCLSGNSNVGKTSLVRAGLLPDLRRSGCTPIYVRCRAQGDLEADLRTELARAFSASFDGLDTAAMLSRAGQLASSRVVIFLDQFERPCRVAHREDQARASLEAFVKELIDSAGDRVTVVFVSVDEAPFWKLMVKAASGRVVDSIEIRAFTRSGVARLVRSAAMRGGVPLDAVVVTALCDEYQKGLDARGDGQPFGLTHVQTVCYYLVRGSRQTWQGAGRLPPSLAAALESLREDASLLDVLAELPAEERRLIRSFLKVICDPDNNPSRIIAFIKKHFPDIKEDRFPEPIV